MNRYISLVSVCFGILILTQCYYKHDNDSEIKVTSSSTKPKSKNLLIGEWKSSNSIWYSSELKLLDNGTFTYHSQGCLGQRFTKGKWTNNDGILKLTSFDEFNQNKEIEIKKPKAKLKNGKDKIVWVSIPVASPSILSGPNDTVKIYLNQVKLQLRNDTLYCIGTEKFLKDEKFYNTNMKH